MKKEFIDIFVELADDADKSNAKRIARVLEKNGVDSIDKLVNMEDNAIYALPGIGDSAMRIIGVIKTRERFKAEKKLTEYKKLKGKSIPKDFRYYAVRAGCTSLGAYQFERILKKNGVMTMSDFMETSQERFSQMAGIGVKRLQQIIDIKCMISKDAKKKK